MRHIRGLVAIWLFLMLSTVGIGGAAPPEGLMTWGLHFSPTPGWFDPSELAGTVTSYHTLYALHDAVIRPSPGTGRNFKKHFCPPWICMLCGLLIEAWVMYNHRST
jgi:hypothetical protein